MTFRAVGGQISQASSGVFAANIQRWVDRHFGRFGDDLGAPLRSIRVVRRGSQLARQTRRQFPRVIRPASTGFGGGAG